MRIRNLFEEARVCTPRTRRLGWEVETLHIGSDGRPITREVSRAIFGRLRDREWTPSEVKGGEVVGLDLPVAGMDLPWRTIYELGAGNIETISPTFGVNRAEVAYGLAKLGRVLSEVHGIARDLGAFPVEGPYDGHSDVDTLMLPDERDRTWLTLDGDVLRVLGHIASVHISVDLVSLDEGFAFIRALNELYARMDWPPRQAQDIWGRYIRESHANYEPGRYGPPPESWGEYQAVIGTYRPVMNRRLDGHLEMIRPSRPLHAFNSHEHLDLELFLRSVWWWSRLRVRRGNLVLEIRAIPRGSDNDIITHTNLVLSTTLGLLQ